MYHNKEAHTWFIYLKNKRAADIFSFEDHFKLIAKKKWYF